MNLKQALVLVPGLAADSVISVLSDGPTNSSFLVKHPSGLSVLRIDKPLARDLGLDRIAENAIVKTVSLAGIGADPLYFDEGTGVSLRRYLPGRSWHQADLEKMSNLQSLAGKLRELHALPPVGNTYEPGRAARRYAQQLGTRQAREFADKANLLLAELRFEQSRICLCHNDLVAGNLIENDARLMLIDWEYAGPGDPWFDLALVIEHHQLGEVLESGFIQAYLQRDARESELHRLASWRKFYSALLALWHLRTE